MPDDVKISIIDRGSPESGGRRFLYARIKIIETGKQIERSTGVPRGADWPDDVPRRQRDKANRVAADIAKEVVESGTESTTSKRISWREFRSRFETEFLPSRAASTRAEYATTLALLEEALPVVRDGKPRDLTASRISTFETFLRKREVSEFTIRKHLSNVRALLNWAHRLGLIQKRPKVEMPQSSKNGKQMKGRPITGEEFERMLAAVPRVVLSVVRKRRTRIVLQVARLATSNAPRAAELRAELADVDRAFREIVASWRRLLRGLWLSGLRLAEALKLHWTDDRALCVDFNGRRPMFRIRGEAQKSRRDETLPMAPEFAEFLDETPADDRTGFVFAPLSQRRQTSRMLTLSVSKIISAIGKAAKVKVDESAKGRVKFASAHDLRRAFGDRWSRLVMPAVLQKLMRHQSIDTTMRFYVGSEADTIADVLWQNRATPEQLPTDNGATGGYQFGDSLGDTRQNSPVFDDAFSRCDDRKSQVERGL